MDGNMCLIDFGISKQLEDTMDRTATVLGTAQYMPPEVYQTQDGGYAFSFDLWSLGCTLYEIVVGQPPFNVSGFESIDDASSILSTSDVKMKDYFSKDFSNLL